MLKYTPPEELLTYLQAMQLAIRYSLLVAYQLAIQTTELILPSPIDLRKAIKSWYQINVPYAAHHINPVVRTAVALLRSYRKNHQGQLRLPQARKLAMRLDTELFKLDSDRLRVTLQPRHYCWLPLPLRHKKWLSYLTTGRLGEVLVTDTVIVYTFVFSEAEKPLAPVLCGCDLNFKTIDSTTVHYTPNPPQSTLKTVHSESLVKIVKTQNDYSRRRRQLQRHIPNPAKRHKKLRATRQRQRHIVTDLVHKLTTTTVRTAGAVSFVFENLKGIRKTATKPQTSKKLRTYLNRWPYRFYQTLIEYKSPYRTLYVSPRGTSSYCPVCGERRHRLKHPTWKESLCPTCAVTYDRDRLSSLEISCRGLRLCGAPCTVSAWTSWITLKDEYRYVPPSPKRQKAGGTELPNVPKTIVQVSG